MSFDFRLFRLLDGNRLYKGGTPQAPAPSAPPPTSTDVEVQVAKRDARLQAARRKGVQASILAGETGGYQPVERNTLLGGKG